MRKHSLMTPYICITEVVKHIVTASAKLYKGTKYENNWFFYHDALSLMTSTATLEWMVKQGYFKYWILPVLGLNEDDPDLSQYIGCPVGNCPENMPWDTSLNQDLHEAVWAHVSMTFELHQDCPKKFDLSTPKRGASAYIRVLEGVPSDKRIQQDINLVFENMNKVRLARGGLVLGMGRNYGRRYVVTERKMKRGGHNPRKQALDEYVDSKTFIHPDAKPCLNAMMTSSVQRNAGLVGVKPIIGKMVLN